jgi:flavin reductase (DIM6/NTAB) family NADH-FMN oxidoreductase RutF
LGQIDDFHYDFRINCFQPRARRFPHGLLLRDAADLRPMKRASPPNFDQSAFKQALSQFATGVTVITTRADSGQLIGITASSFNSVSLDPPLVLWSLATRSASMPVFRANSHYVVNVLASSQLDLCKRFATVKGDRFEGVSHAQGDTGMPVLDGALAWFECHNRSRYEEGDHVIFVGEVERCGVHANAAKIAPLVFQNGLFHGLEPL